MKIEYEKIINQIYFRDLDVGNTFISQDLDECTICLYIKIKEDEVFNFTNNKTIEYDDFEMVIPVEAEIS